LFLGDVRTGLDWLEISITTDTEAAEAVVELFNRYGQGRAVVETPLDCFEYELPAAPPPSTVIVKTYLPMDASADDARRHLEEGLWHLGQLYPIPEPIIHTIAEQDWAESWKQQYHLQRIGQRTVIVPAWEEYEPAPGEVVIRLEPGMAFGTGLHPTTRLCLQLLEQHLVVGSDVLDVGTGSGILAIAAAKMGSRRVLALEADLTAVPVARENVSMNGVSEQVSVRHATLPGGSAVPLHFVGNSALEVLDAGHFDLVLINILAPVIIGVARDLAARLAPSGCLIAAGLIESQEADVTQAFRLEGLEVTERNQEKDWVALVARRR
jgi:ribosomal protein L11 methyltransferase